MIKIDRTDDLTAACCPVSGSTDVSFLCEIDNYKIYRCAESSTDFVWPMPAEADLEEIYNREEWFTGSLPGGYVDYDEQTMPSLDKMASILDRFPNGGKGLSILDVGCGYGSHLKVAADRGWKCFGIELSSHARSVVKERYGNQLSVVEKATDLIPQQFDLILMLDVIEHLSEPYKLFFTLFGRGAIGQETQIVISTPNARCFDAVSEPAEWAYRHPPSHLVYYSSKSFEILARRLLFTDIKIEGAVTAESDLVSRFEDEEASSYGDFGEYQGLFVVLSGSHFKEFMHERYVPGGFWKLTEYEHIPRYSYASMFAKGNKVLDFGCGTGYGSSALSRVADSVLGLDISDKAIEWAKETHGRGRDNLHYERRDDLGQGLSAASFDLITNFEMIEHVDHETQIKVVQSFSRLLKTDGKLIISTPDPSYTAPYGDNPYHLREMTESEFMELLEPHFKYVLMLKQWVRPSIAIGEYSVPHGMQSTIFEALDKDGGFDSLVGFVAICSNEAFDSPPFYCQFDTSEDFNLATLKAEIRKNEGTLDMLELLKYKDINSAEIEKRDKILVDSNDWAETLNADKQALESEIEKRDKILDEIEHSLVWRAAKALRLVKYKGDR